MTTTLLCPKPCLNSHHTSAQGWKHGARLVILTLGLAAMDGAAQAVPAEPELLAAGINTPTVQFGKVKGRTVRLWIEVARLPPCSNPMAQQGLELGFLIDPRRLAKETRIHTGLDIQPTARVRARCDSEQGWISPVGTVRVSPVAAGHRLEILTRVEKLPASLFRWVAYLRQGRRAVVFPPPLNKSPQEGPPGFAQWAVLERAMP